MERGKLFASESLALHSGHLWSPFLLCVTQRTLSLHLASTTCGHPQVSPASRGEKMAHLSSDCHGPVIFEAYTFLSGACAVCACGTQSTRASPPHVVVCPPRFSARHTSCLPGQTHLLSLSAAKLGMTSWCWD